MYQTIVSLLPPSRPPQIRIAGLAPADAVRVHLVDDDDGCDAHFSISIANRGCSSSVAATPDFRLVSLAQTAELKSSILKSYSLRIKLLTS